VRSLTLVLVALVLGATAARADEGEWALSGCPSFGTFGVNQGGKQLTASGGLLNVDLEHGVTDSLWIRATLGGGVYAGPSGTSWNGTATAGITYTIDILRYVPYVNLGLGVMALGGGGFDTQAKLLIELGAGLDIIESTKWSWGVALRFDSFASSVAYFTVGPRISWRWGFF
jgi:hypothetical protein